MATLARVFIALVTCPVLGAAIGQDLARNVAPWAPGAAAGTLLGTSTGLAVGGIAGVAFALVAIVCATARGEQVRRCVADPVLIALASAAVLELLVRRWNAGQSAASTVRSVTIAVWVLGLVFVLLASRHRPEPEPHAEEGDEVERPSGPGAGMKSRTSTRDLYPEEETDDV